jgi:UDP-N-acetylmuramoyl-tripeptide--D-alanyl-D-alanine ligase
MTSFIEFLYSRFLLSDGVSIDTRTIEKGNLFFAISGPNFNANKFAKDALERGAAYAVVDDEAYKTDERIVVAENCLKALQDLALFHRKRFKKPVLGITGSNGKTTTKELIANVLSQKFIVHATAGNYNNHIGVPLTLLHIHPQIEMAIVEMGANHVGEIAQLSELSLPTHGLITNIGHAHTEGFGGFEGVIRGKSELFDYLRKNNGKAFVNMNDKVLSNMSKRFSNPILYPTIDLKLVSSAPYLEVELAGNKCKTQLTGKYNLDNIAAAISVGREFGVTDDQIMEALSSYKPENSRSQIIQKGSTTIIMDAYNANPDSMKVALESLAEQNGRKVAILGDMNELQNPDEEHQNILILAGNLGIEVKTIGGKIGKVAEASTHFSSKEKLEENLRNENFSNATVLLKASRSIKLETILNSIS